MNMNALDTVIKSCDSIAHYSAMLKDCENGDVSSISPTHAILYPKATMDDFKKHLMMMIDCHKTLFDEAYKVISI